MPEKERRGAHCRLRSRLRLSRRGAADLDRPIDPALEAWLLEHLAGAEPLGEGYQASVRRLASPAGEVVIKSPHGGWLRGPIGRHAIRRESEVYRCLEGIPGIPRAFGLADGAHLVLELVEGPSLRTHEQSLAAPERFFQQLLDTILAMHAAGVAHGDLKRKDNIVVGPGERPYIIDFGIARLRGAHPGPLRRLLFDQVRQMDLNAWIKLKHGRNPAELPPADTAIYRPLWIERIARAFRVPWQKLTLRRPRQRWRQRWQEWRDSRGGRPPGA